MLTPQRASFAPDVKSSCILVPVKGVAGEEEVLRLAFTLAGPPGDRRSKQRTQIEVIHVIEVPQALALDAEMPDAIQAGEQALARAEQLAAQREITIEAEMLQARSAGIAIVDEAIERGADLIIMGAVYRSQHGEFNLGGTLPYVFKNAPCRVLVMRSPKPEGEEKRGKG
ncbi:MAG TPA: universal stress protein [Chloroflexia bacterium]|nr:universal stress protein [Chloroflexia bacterium]